MPDDLLSDIASVEKQKQSVVVKQKSSGLLSDIDAVEKQKAQLIPNQKVSRATSQDKPAPPTPPQPKVKRVDPLLANRLAQMGIKPEEAKGKTAGELMRMEHERSPQGQQYQARMKAIQAAPNALANPHSQAAQAPYRAAMQTSGVKPGAGLKALDPRGYVKTLSEANPVDAIVEAVTKVTTGIDVTPADIEKVINKEMGGWRGPAQVLHSLAEPQNIALMAVIPEFPASVQKAVGLYFTGLMTKGAKQSYDQMTPAAKRKLLSGQFGKMTTDEKGQVSSVIANSAAAVVAAHTTAKGPLGEAIKKYGSERIANKLTKPGEDAPKTDHDKAAVEAMKPSPKPKPAVPKPTAKMEAKPLPGETPESIANAARKTGEGHLRPRVGKSTPEPKGEPNNAAEEGKKQEDQTEQHKGNDSGGASAEPGGGSRLRPTKKVKPQEKGEEEVTHETSDQKDVGTRKYDTNKLVEEWGLKPTDMQPYDKIAEAYPRAKEIAEKDPEAVDALVNRLIKKPETTSPLETGMLGHRLKALDSRLVENDKATMKAMAEGNDAEVKALSEKRAVIADKMQETISATRKAGREASAALSAFKLRVADSGDIDMVRTYATRTKGAPLSSEEGKQLEKAVNEYKAAFEEERTKRLAAEERATAHEERKEAIAEAVEPESAAKKPRAPKGTGKAAFRGEHNTIFTQEKYNAAVQRLKAKGGEGIGTGGNKRTRGAIDLEPINDWIEVGGHFIEGGLRDFADWSKAMLNINHNLSLENLNVIWTNARNELNKRAQAERKPLSQVFVDKLTRRMKRQGATDFANDVNANHPGLLDRLFDHPDKLSTDDKAHLERLYHTHNPDRPTPAKPEGAIKVLTDIVAESKEHQRVHNQLLEHLKTLKDPEAIRKPEPSPRKTASDRIEQARKDRDIAMQKVRAYAGLNEAKEEAKTGIRRVVNRSRMPSDEELEGIRAKRAITQQMNALNARIKRMEAGEKAAAKSGKPKPTSPELEAMRRKVKDLQEAQRELDKANRLKAEMADLQEQLRTGKFKVKVKTPRPEPTAEEKAVNEYKQEIAARVRIADLIKESRGLKTPEQKKKAVEAAPHILALREDARHWENAARQAKEMAEDYTPEKKTKKGLDYDQSNTQWAEMGRRYQAWKQGKKYEKRLRDTNAKIADLENQLETGKFKPNATKSKPVLPAELRTAMEKRVRLNAQVQARIAGMEPTTGLQKAVAVSTMFKLAHVKTLIKLPLTSVANVTSESVADTLGYPFGAASAGGGKTLRQAAPGEGSGFHPVSVAKGLQAVFSRGTLKDIKEQARSHTDFITAQAQEAHPEVTSRLEAVASLPGKLHGIEKTPLRRYHYYKYMDQMTRQIVSDKMIEFKGDKDKVEAYLRSPEGMTAITARSAAEAVNQTLMNDNRASALVNGTFEQFDRNPSKGLRAVSALVKSIFFPVTRVPINQLAKGGRMIGGPVSMFAGEMMRRNAIKHLGPGEVLDIETATEISRLYKYGGLGLAMWYAGFKLPQYYNAGGFYTNEPKTKRTPAPKEDPMTMKIMGHEFSELWSHGAVQEAAQMIGSTKIGVDEALQKGDSMASALVHGILYHGARGLLSEAPGTYEMEQIGKLQGTNEEQANKAIGLIIGGEITPGIVEDFAKATDKPFPPGAMAKLKAFLHDPATPREEKTAIQTLMAEYPWFREKLPVKLPSRQHRGGSGIK